MKFRCHIFIDINLITVGLLYKNLGSICSGQFTLNIASDEVRFWTAYAFIWMIIERLILDAQCNTLFGVFIQ